MVNLLQLMQYISRATSGNAERLSLAINNIRKRHLQSFETDWSNFGQLL